MSIDPEQWRELRSLAGRVFRSSLHFSVATTNADGTPHLAPIGSLILTDPGNAYFFEIFARSLGENLDRGSPVMVLGVVSARALWVPSLIAGRFSSRPAFRLVGEAGDRRRSTKDERDRWQRKVRLVRWTRGHRILWGNAEVVRDLRFHTLQPVRIGPLTSHLDREG